MNRENESRKVGQSATGSDLVFDDMRPSANLRNANLAKADLRDANLRGANLAKADLRSADLRGAYLQNANLQSADLRGAYLQNANLWDADLWGANLKNANLWGANLQSANLPSCLRIQGSRDLILAFPYHVQIGCIIHSLATWLTQFQQEGRINGYTPDQIEEYHLHLLHVQQWMSNVPAMDE